MRDTAFEAWIDAQWRYSIPAMLRSVSAMDLVKERPGFGQTVRPARGSVIASPVFGGYDPDPDYCYHWFRDSAVVFDALRIAYEADAVGDEALGHLRDFVRFSLDLQRLDGREAVLSAARRERVAPELRHFLREDTELAAVQGERVVAESRVNADGTLDSTRWARPQHDGPPLRALALLRWLRLSAIDADLADELAVLIHADLAFTHTHWREPSYDIWEEDRGHHYYDLRVSTTALAMGADWLAARGDAAQATEWRDASRTIEVQLDDYWMPDAGHFRSRFVDAETDAKKALDIALILAVIHADAQGAAHSVHDPRMHATLDRLDAAFDSRYGAGRQRLESQGPALGRYTADVYYGGKAWYVATLAAAEFCFRAARGGDDAQRWIARGDAYLRTVRRYVPADGAMSEQFDPATGEQLSAKHLAWSYAAFITCVAARRAALNA